jgi:DNA-binding transcriptional ArsR family regulator
MPRSPTTADAFTAIAEVRRRDILRTLATSGEERDVSWLVDTLGWPQPQVSKHLGVLRKVGLVTVAKRGKHRLYRLNAQELRPVYEWVKSYERFWEQQLDRIKERAEQKAREAEVKKSPNTR